MSDKYHKLRACLDHIKNTLAGTGAGQAQAPNPRPTGEYKEAIRQLRSDFGARLERDLVGRFRRAPLALIHDAISEVFAKLLRRNDEGTLSDQLTALLGKRQAEPTYRWLRIVAFNRLIDLLRQEKIRKDKEAKARALRGAVVAPDTSVEQADARDAIARAVADELDAEEQRIFHQVYERVFQNGDFLTAAAREAGADPVQYRRRWEGILRKLAHNATLRNLRPVLAVWVFLCDRIASGKAKAATVAVFAVVAVAGPAVIERLTTHDVPTSHVQHQQTTAADPRPAPIPARREVAFVAEDEPGANPAPADRTVIVDPLPGATVGRSFLARGAVAPGAPGGAVWLVVVDGNRWYFKADLTRSRGRGFTTPVDQPDGPCGLALVSVNRADHALILADHAESKRKASWRGFAPDQLPSAQVLSEVREIHVLPK